MKKTRLAKWFLVALTMLLVSGVGVVKASSGNPQQPDSEINENNKKDKKMKAIELTKDEFLKKVVDYESNPKKWNYLGDKPAVIDFYAPWCGPCKALAPVLDELADEYKEDIHVYKVNTDNEKELAAAFGIRSIPTLLFVPMEGDPQMSQGALPKKNFKEAIDTLLLKKEEEKTN